MVWLLAPAAYLFGGIPFGLILGRLRGVDVRSEGSQNIGATNVWRTCGPACGLLAFVLDVAKGYLPVILAQHLAPEAHLAHVVAGLAALGGHVCSPFLGFAGGKGVSTTLGVILALDPLAALIGLLVWALLLRLTGFVSIGSLAGSLSTAVVASGQQRPWSYQVAIWVAVILIWVKHRANIGRLLRGEELPVRKRSKQPPAPPSEPEA
jgi:glycerol-3-phosphate acyltransferase PlsY